MNYADEMTPLVGNEGIAVIGMSCRLPGAANYEEFWENLKAGRSSIEEVPANRWTWQAFWGDPQTEKNKSNSKWGGFLNDVDNFDANFFGLSAKEVERMDPQQRIMLELTWSCFEDAGIRPSDVSGKKIGIFLGVFNFDYKELQERNGLLSIEAHHSTGTAPAMIANRISYYFNFTGPSLPIDTACSSSLTAIHSAIQSLVHGECTMAVAGGINLLLTPTRHISFSKTGMLSPTGSCKSFDENADGYVRGEGAGLLLLKPMRQALADKDNIYGVIKGSAINHGGKTYSLTYPNPQAQRDVIIDAQKISGFSPETIGYVEAHGTGTPKGDPIEFQGLTEAFRPGAGEGDNVVQKHYCGLGSVKTNIGHLEAAAGVAGIIKVLLSMKHKQLPGLQNFKTLNHRISLDDSPFYLVTRLQEWTTLRDKDCMEIPRRAGVSSFGFGGTNAHVILEEAPARPEDSMAKDGKRMPPWYLVCLSAKTGENLVKKEKDLAAWLNNNPSPGDIADICKTLSGGREHFQKRSVFIVQNTQQLQEKLSRPEKQTDMAGGFRNLQENKKEPAQQLFVEVGRLITDTLNSNQHIEDDEYRLKLVVLAELYLKGYDPDWEKPWFGSNGRRIGLPAYPFTAEHYWIPELDLTHQTIPIKEILHPHLNSLRGTNTSDFRGQRFSITLTGLEPFVKDHTVKGKRILPAVAYLEMIRSAIIESTGHSAPADALLNLKNIVWTKPVSVEESDVLVHTALFIDTEDNISFEVFSEVPGQKNEAVIYSQGIARFERPAVHPIYSIEELKQNRHQVIFKEECYRIFREKGLDYGPAHRSLSAVYRGSGLCLAKLLLPAGAADPIDTYFLHPSLMDAALQACLLSDWPDVENDAGLYLPFAVDHLEIIAAFTEEMWAVITPVAGKSVFGKPALILRMNIDLCTGEGKVCASMKGVSFKLLETERLNGREWRKEEKTLLFTPDWKKKAAASPPASNPYAQHLVFLCEPGITSAGHLESGFPDARFILLQGAEENPGLRYQNYTRKVVEEIQVLLKKPKGKILVQIVLFEREETILFAGLSGLLKTARLENPGFTGQLIRMSSGEDTIRRLKENASDATDGQIRYTEGQRSVLGWKEVISDDDGRAPWKDNGVYLITGGAGGLGLIFAKEIATKVKAPSIILTGRSPLDGYKTAQLEELKELTAGVEYRQTDVSNKRALNELIQDIKNNFGGLNGIIHSAGVVQDNFIIRKTPKEVIAVLSAKVSGATWLDELTKELPLDVFILFSSIVGPLGNIGQGDYAAANAYLDEFADYRNRLVALGRRYGHTLSVNWPLWKDGGMRLGDEMKEVLLEHLKMNLLETRDGIRALYRAITGRVSRVMVAPGRPEVVKAKYLGITEQPTEQPAPNADLNIADLNIADLNIKEAGISEKRATRYFKELLSVTIKRPVEQIDAEAAMEEYGIDSVMVMQMTRQMENVFGSLPKTLFFEYQNIEELTQYFIGNHAEKLAKLLRTEPIAGAGNTELMQAHSSPVDTEPISLSTNGLPDKPRFMTSLPHAKKPQPERQDDPTALDIAIIGVAGRYPQADSIGEFWDNLRNGKDCITEIPRDRWDYRLYFDPNKENEGKSYTKWGGFLNDVDKFDPLFFNITPLEAERMDPQERLFLQCVYQTIEDAGYTRHTLSGEKHLGLGNQVGVYVGVMYEEYQLIGAQEALCERPVALWGLPSSIANRVSYYCDFHGPSMAVDTMCSSSLTAIHLACESIVRGKCELAIAGGVNVSVHPNKYLFLSQGRFASSKGRCESFGIGGDGYVPGEGVGSVLLKPLNKAIAHGDHIYGIIKATAINHGGKTNGYTVPNLKAQASVIGSAFKEAGIDPRALSYLEAHGTGTALGDPIEIAALSRAMQAYTTDTRFCAIGSAKSNIGHCESAAGIAGVTKVLLQLKYRQLAPSLHSETLNSNIDFVNSPFMVQQHLSEWKRPALEKNGETKEYPLIAGISSFGAGGANAHIVIEEYIPDNLVKPSVRSVNKEATVVILLSATDEDRLIARAKQVVTVLREKRDGAGGITEDWLANMAYTLQIGREHMECRLALLVSSIDELQEKLDGFIAGLRGIEGVFHGQATARMAMETSFIADEDMREAVKAWMTEKKFEKLLAAWVKGLKAEWRELYDETNLPHRISMPGYPFKKERYWVGDEPGRPGDLRPVKGGRSFIHPLLHENTSDLSGQRFCVNFTGEELFLKDHLVNGRKILPAVASLEMMREAVWQSVRSYTHKITDVRLKNIVWALPVIVEEKGIAVHIELQGQADGRISFEVYGKDFGLATEKEIYARGSAILQPLTGIGGIGETGIFAVQKECNNKIIAATECYEAFERTGFHYGPAHRGLEQVYIGDTRILAKISLPPVANDSRSSFFMHPSLMDSALQACLLWNWKETGSKLEMLLPFAVEEVTIHKETPPVVWARITRREDLQDIDIMDEQGNICIRLKGIAFKLSFPKGMSIPAAVNSPATLLLWPEWEKREIHPSNPVSTFSRHIIILIGLTDYGQELAAQLPGGEVIVLGTIGTAGIDGFGAIAEPVFLKLQSLLKEKPKGNILVQTLIPSNEEERVYGGISGLLRTARKENPRLFGQVIRVAAEDSSPHLLIKIRENSRAAFDTDILYEDGRRDVLVWKTSNNDPREWTPGSERHPWKAKGVYLLTGGTGGLGFIFAEEIARNAQGVILVLTGRSSLDQHKTDKIDALRKMGAIVEYRQMDITVRESVMQLIRSIQEDHGGLQGIIHSAGVVRDNFLINKTIREWEEVLAPKVNGLRFLDLASRDIPLDIFVFFSSVTGAVGNAGQADYATANAFMDEYAEYRHYLAANGLRHGHTLSVNWPLWQEGGMQVSAEAEGQLFDSMGMTPLPTRSGIESFYKGLLTGRSRVMVLHGDRARIHEKIIGPDIPETTSDQPAVPLRATGKDLPEEVMRYFRKLLSSVVKLPEEKIRPDVSIEEYGIDSVMVMKLTGKLEKSFGTLSKTLFFEYQNIRELATYFWEEHYSKLMDMAGLAGEKAPVKVEAMPIQQLRNNYSPSQGKEEKQPDKKEPYSLDIAIVGLSGRYPQADDLETFWENLCEGKDCITEIPPARWDHSLYFDADRDRAGKTYSKWGGFMNGVDEFDPLFFNISPREAELLDPQERLFLQCAYETMEDAGYSRQTLAGSEEGGLSGNIGVYVGVMYEEYQLFGVQETMKGRNIALFGNPSSIANRVSYFFNFNGPSMAVDTMCSSSLTAIHLACQGIYNGDCKAAIAGGVNISIHPNKYLLLAQGKFISSKGRCESFGIGGDGYVPGEGVGSVFLKPLSQAIADGDHVYGVIKGTSINHGGKTNGYTVPNPNAQAKVIKKAYERCGIDPRTISYLEAHGTGTSLGDPIEISGLTKAFRDYTKDNGFCAIGSVKSNIGHGESAAGIAGLTKILLQLKHRQLVPSLHSELLNSKIDFADSPFVVQQGLSEWKRPVIGVNEQAWEYARRAGISSFGAGGANAHLVIEEFNDSLSTGQPNSNRIIEPVIILISARNEGRLRELAERILKVLQKGSFKDSDLPDIAFTLQTGRDALEARLAMIVKTIAAFVAILEGFLKGEDGIDGMYRGKVEKDDRTIDAFTADEELQEAIKKWMARKKHAKICEFWVRGLNIDWSEFYKGDAGKSPSFKRVSLPTHPFAKERYWISTAEPAGQSTPTAEEPFALLTFEEEWIEQSLDDAFAKSNASASPSLSVIVCFLSDKRHQQQLLETSNLINHGRKIIFISRNGEATDPSSCYCLESPYAESYTQVIRKIEQQHGSIHGFVYLWAFEDPRYVDDYTPIVYLLQAIGAAKLGKNKVLLAGKWSESSRSGNPTDRCYLESWIGFARSTELVLPGTEIAVLYQESGPDQPDLFNRSEPLWGELLLPGSHEALYKAGKRYSIRTRKSRLPTGTGLLRQGGTYLITGGLGGLGLVFAGYLAERYNANLILTGRSPVDGEKQRSIEQLKRSGNKVVYLQADVCDAEKMKEGLASAREKTGAICGLIHAAGIEKEGFILNRNIEDFTSILSPKIGGTILLDELLKDEPLDFACYFSSSSAILGDFGSCDYAIGNRFEMAFARYRSGLQSKGLRHGHTIAINWPLWKDGGMNLKSKDNARMYLVSSGQRYLEKAEGLEIFERLLVQGMPLHQLVIAGKESKVNRFLGMTPATPPDRETLPAANAAGRSQAAEETKDTTVEERLESDMLKYVSELLKIPVDRMDPHENLADIGFDSVTLTQLAATLSKELGADIAPALFFSYPTIYKLTRYLLKEKHQLISTRYGGTPPAEHPSGHEPIAIIGMSGRFPQARNIEEMWKILEEGANAVSEICGDRFDWRLYYSGESIEEGKTNCKWTGLIPGIREFDPLFFEISPQEAGSMDPRQRLLLQEGWRALEDAGYGKIHLENNKVALYVGVEEGNYAALAGSQETVTSNHNAILAARLSYFLNLSGPNMAINTACSSGLVAAHQAIQSLQNNECDTAIAAGVNLMIAPEPYIAMSQAGMLSVDGTCYTFDKRANGMVPGEAVAVIVLKRLSKAIADGDPVYATITGSGINYDGKTNGITAPSGLSQMELLRGIYDKYQVNPENIEYIVTHGTGTRLGDPVEINALYDAFKGYTGRQNYCALTSVKTNFGHTFAASGLVSLISLVQAMRHEKIPASLNCKEDSDYINWDKSPFFINKSLKAWPSIPGKARTGGVSSFGMSGTNAHIVAQSYDANRTPTRINDFPYYLLPLSARTAEALEEKIGDLILHLKDRERQELTMAEMSYTLMAGRHHFKYRCVLIAKDRTDAIHLLTLAGKNEETTDCIRGEVPRVLKTSHETIEHIIDLIREALMFRNDPQKYRNCLLGLADLYCQGHDIPWERIFPEQTPKRIHLPAYPFSRKEYWVSNGGEKDPADTIPAPKQWLFSREELIASPFRKEIDWNTRLSRFIGRRICMVYSDVEERDSLCDLLSRLEIAGQLSEKLNVSCLHSRDLNTDSMKKIRPEIIFFLGPQEQTPVAAQPVESDISAVFQLSRSLMQAAWEEPVRLYFLYNSLLSAPRLDCEALSGLLSSAMRENPAHSWKTIRLCDAATTPERHQFLLKEWLQEIPGEEDTDGFYTEVHYIAGERFIKKLVETKLPVPVKPVFGIGKNYMIVGGTGYIGGLLLREIARKYKATLFILARSRYDEKIADQCNTLKELGAEVHYFSTDVTNLESLEETYRQIKSLKGKIHGVVNLARAHDTRIIAAKSWESFYTVSLVKIRTARYLDQLTKDEPLDFFILFAAMAAFGASGESDYAYSCAFQNAFVKYRNRLRTEGKRAGMAVAQCWGPWAEDRLFPGHVEKWTKFGCDLIDMKSAFPLIEATCIYPHGDIGINAVKDAAKIRTWFGIGSGTSKAPVKDRARQIEEIIERWEEDKIKGILTDFTAIREAISVGEMDTMPPALVDRIYNICFEEPATLSSPGSDNLQIIREAIGEVLQLEKIDDEEPFQNYGLDSIKAMRLSTRLEKKMNRPVQPQWFIEFPTVIELSRHLNSINQTILS